MFDLSQMAAILELTHNAMSQVLMSAVTLHSIATLTEN